MNLMFADIQILGKENLPDPKETVIFVPNHTSFLDILTLSGYIPRAFKYLSKAEVIKMPVVGWGMMLAKHVFLHRNDITDATVAKEKCIQHVRLNKKINIKTFLFVFLSFVILFHICHLFSSFFSPSKQKLQNGNSLVLFAEGARSLDGRMRNFKKGAFHMAKQCNVRIIPVSIGNLHIVMPPSCLLPIGIIK